MTCRFNNINIETSHDPSGEAQEPQTKWKEELYYRLSYKLQHKVMLERMDNSITFADFTQVCSKMAVCLKQRAVQKNARNRRTAPSIKNAKKEGQAGLKPRTISLSMDERKELLAAGKCFSCKKQGHLPVCGLSATNNDQTHWKPNSSPDSCPQANGRRPGGVGKRRALRKVSLLGQLGIDLSSLSLDNIDLGELLGGKGFLVHTKVAFNNIAIPVRSIADSGASGPTFMDSKRAIKFAHFFNVLLHPLLKHINTTAF